MNKKITFPIIFLAIASVALFFNSRPHSVSVSVGAPAESLDETQRIILADIAGGGFQVLLSQEELLALGTYSSRTGVDPEWEIDRRVRLMLDQLIYDGNAAAQEILLRAYKENQVIKSAVDNELGK